MSVTKFLCAALLCLAVGAVSASEFSSLEEKMTSHEFNAAGLERLSPDELARLNQWLRNNWPRTAIAGAHTGTAAGDQRGFVQRMIGSTGDEIIARIPGTFTGWNSRSEFRLDNGMVWRADESASLSTRAMENPQITIRKGMFDVWYLRVEGYNSQIKVRRVE